MNEQELAQLSSTVVAALNSATPQAERAVAFKFFEDIKHHQDCCLMGFALAATLKFPAEVRRYGLQLIIGYIQRNWGDISRNDQIQIKNKILGLLEKCSSDEEFFVKDCIAHALTEVIKRVWPQYWPTMVPDLIKKGEMGLAQIELVELIFMRISEDIAVLQNVKATHRSQDIRHGLSLSMKEVLDFLVNVLNTAVVKYISLVGTTNESEQKECKMYFHLCETTLKTFETYFEWASVEHIFTSNGLIIDKFFELLKIENLKIMAIECLIQLVQRKGQPAERQHILSMTSDKYVQLISKAIAQTSTSETGYAYMKLTGQFLSCLVSQIASSWVLEVEANCGCIHNLKNFRGFLDLLMNFLKIDDYSISDCVCLSVQNLVRHHGLSKDEVLLSYIDSPSGGLIEITAMKLFNCHDVQLPSQARYDFNDDDEMKTFLANHKMHLLQILRACAVALPNIAIRKILEWIEKEIDCCPNGTDMINMTGSFRRWDTLKSIADIFIKSGLIYAERARILDSKVVVMGVQVLKRILVCTANDVQMSQCLLSLIGAFFPFLRHWPDPNETVVAVIHKVTIMLEATGHHTTIANSTVTLFRRHCLSSIVHISKYYTDLVAPVYEAFKNEFGKLFGIVGNHEMIPLFESMILVSGDWKDYHRQQSLIEEIFQATSDNLVSASDACLEYPKEFAHAIGITCSSENFLNEGVKQFRMKISFSVALILALVERSQVPDDQASLQNGGFINSEGQVMSPCGTRVMSALPFIAKLVGCFHSLWTSELRNVIHNDFSKSLDIRDSEKMSMIASGPVTSETEENKSKPVWERMQSFILLVLENCYQILGKAGKCCHMDLYNDPALFPSFLKKVFTNFVGLPELRRRSFTRQFLYYFLKHCPETLTQKIAGPLLSGYCNQMNEILEKQWASFAKKEQARLKIFESFDGDIEEFDGMREADEILQEQLLRTVSRVYLDLLVNLCVNKGAVKKPQQQSEDTDGKESRLENDAEMSDLQGQGPAVGDVYNLSDMGKLLFQTEHIEPILMTSLFSFSWYDTTTVFKGIQLAWPLIKLIATFPSINDGFAQFIFESVLKGLQRHGEYDGCCGQFMALSSHVYVSLRPSHESLYKVLESIPGVDRSAVKTFDMHYLKYAEKKRKNQLKKILSVLIEKHVGQKFKNTEVMSKLPRMFSQKKKTGHNDATEIANISDLFKP